MAFGKTSLQRIFEDQDRANPQAKAVTQRMKATIAAGNVNPEELMGLANNLGDFRTLFTRVTANAGMVAYAQTQYSDGAFDIVASYTAVLAAIDDALLWIETNIPKDAATGWLHLRKFTAAGGTTFRTFSTAALAPLDAKLDVVIAALG